MEIGVLFADIRGFTAWSEKNSPTAAGERLTQFYRLVSRVLTRDDALVELVGDQVMAFYLPEFPSLREGTPEVMVAAARRLLRETHRGGGESIPVGVGIHMGVASVGNVRKGEVKDFTVVGDVVNTAARLQSCASADQSSCRTRSTSECQPLARTLSPGRLKSRGSPNQFASMS